MNKTDLDKFRAAIELSQTNRKHEAHRQLKELVKEYPQDFNLMLWTAYTASDMVEAQEILSEAEKLEPHNVQTLQARNWLKEQQSQRLNKRFRSEIKEQYVPVMPPELLTPVALAPVVPAAPSTIVSAVRKPEENSVAEQEEVKPEALEKKIKPKQPKVKAAKVVTKDVATMKQAGMPWWGKILVTLVVLAVIAGGLLAIPQVRDTVFNTGPLTTDERAYLNDINQIDDLATSRINSAYGCLLNGNPKICGVDEGYRIAYVQLGEVRDKFIAMKSPSKRFNVAHNQLESAYSSLGSTSQFAFESINQHKMQANLQDILTRLDSGRKMLEEGKAEIKQLQVDYGKK